MTNLWFVNEGLPGRLSSHCSSIQHGRPTALTSSLVALPASLGLLRPVSRTARGLRAPRRRRPSVPALRTALAFGGAVFRRCAPPSPSAARCSGVADALWACPRASSRFAAFDCALRVLAPPAASRPPTASDRDGNAFLRFAPPSPYGGAVFRACALRVLGTSALRAFTFLQAFAPEKYQK